MVCDLRVHGGPDKAVYAYAREDLDRVGRRARPGPARRRLRGEPRRRPGWTSPAPGSASAGGSAAEVLLEVCAPRDPVPDVRGLAHERAGSARFTERAEPGAYLRVVQPGAIRAGDAIEVVHTPAHDVTIGVAFRALTAEPELLPLLLAADELPGTHQGEGEDQDQPVGRTSA